MTIINRKAFNLMKILFTKDYISEHQLSLIYLFELIIV